MERREVVFSPEAQADLIALYDHIDKSAGPGRAMAYIRRIEAYCLGFDLAGERGRRRDDIRPGLRTVGFERRVTIAFHVEQAKVTVDRVFYGGRNVERVLRRGQRRLSATRPS
ncbi:MAG: toxin ParE1/3/4 [Alphaproteobacteria bacterium]|nr:toxin ParE1/3/4 [Alphaproteobacteria bacterium]